MTHPIKNQDFLSFPIFLGPDDDDDDGPPRARGQGQGPILANVPQFGKTFFFRKNAQNYGMSNLGMKTNVARTEILHILVGLTARGDLYLIVSWTFEIFGFLPKKSKLGVRVGA